MDIRQINREGIPQIEVDEISRVLSGRLPASLNAGRLTHETHREPGCFGYG